jgi:lipid-A-disaccharide synthase
MGFVEVLFGFRKVLKYLSLVKNDILDAKPDILILVDYGGFNMKMAAFGKKHNIPVHYYIPPKVWAWNQKRVLKIKKIVDQLFCILPFEVDFYKKWGMEVNYVGNPLLDEIAQFIPDNNFITQNNLTDKKIIALLPGSRKQEIERLLPDMLGVVDAFPAYQFVVAAAPTFTEAYYQQYIGHRNVKLLFDNTYNKLHHAHAALVASGTATLETALFKVPQVVLYRGGTISVGIARMVIKIKFISLVNLIMDRLVVTELIQADCTTEKININLEAIVAGAARQQMLANYEELSDKMGTAGASERTAKLIVQHL